MQKGRFSTREPTVELSIALKKDKHKENAECQVQAYRLQSQRFQ